MPAPVAVGYSAVPSSVVTLTPSQPRIARGPARSHELPLSISKANDIPGAKRGASGGRRQATPHDVWRRRVQLAGTSSYVRRRPATVRLRLTSEGSQVRNLLRPPGGLHVLVGPMFGFGLPPQLPRPGPGQTCPAETSRAIAYGAPDRKSTRLNSSHANISYAVFCLKKNT